jgi:hypothetical protein
MHRTYNYKDFTVEVETEVMCTGITGENVPATPAVDSVNYDGRLRDNYDVRSTGVIVAVSWL